MFKIKFNNKTELREFAEDILGHNYKINGLILEIDDSHGQTVTSVMAKYYNGTLVEENNQAS
jgi:hypothetical protein